MISNLWILTLPLPAHTAEFFADAFGDDAVAVTILAPPRQDTARIEAIYRDEPQKAHITARLAVLAAVMNIPVPIFALRPAPNLDWLKKVAQNFPPLNIARWVVHGALHRDKVTNRLAALQIDATNAFGTGEHPTTRGCLLMLDQILKSGFRPQSMADIGCGSGILAMAAVKAARCRAAAVDIDADAVRIASANIRVNGLGDKIRVGRGRGYAAPVIRASAPYDLIMANIFAQPLARMAAQLKQNLRPNGVAILSGLLTTQANGVIAAHRLQGLVLTRHMKIGEWSVLALRRPDRA